MAKIEGIGEYFEYQINRCSRSDNSGRLIPNPSTVNIAHILPKRRSEERRVGKEC